MARAPLAGALVAVTLSVVGIGLHSGGGLSPGAGVAYLAGWMSALLCLGLVAYAVPKRFLSRLAKKKKKSSAARRAVGATEEEPRARSRLGLHYLAHLTLGGLVIGGVAIHSGFRFAPSAAGALSVAFWGTVVLGVFGALSYRALPARLTRLERKGALPEDLRAERDLLFDRLHRATSGKSDLLKTIAERILVPYARSPLGPLALAISGRTLGQEESLLKQRVAAVLEGRGGERLEGLDELSRIVVELRALPARRVLTFAIRSWLPMHVLTTGILLSLLCLHIAQMTRW